MKRARVPYFQFYPSDFMNGVRGMTPQEVGVYTMLLCRIYEESGPVEAHTLRLATYCGMREKSFTAVLSKLVELGKISIEDGHITNYRAQVEIQKRSNDLKTASIAGKVSAQKRQEKQQQDATTVQRPFNHTDTDTDTVIKQEPNGSFKKTRGTRLPDDWIADIGFALTLGLSQAQAENEATKFREWWPAQPGQKGVKIDWNLTWKTWCRSAAERSQRSQAPPRKSAYREYQDECAAELDKIINRDKHNDERIDNVIDLGTADYRSERAAGPRR
jgi:uncharacterized protein YdaU (DUF1376 family)